MWALALVWLAAAQADDAASERITDLEQDLDELRGSLESSETSRQTRVDDIDDAIEQIRRSIDAAESGEVVDVPEAAEGLAQAASEARSFDALEEYRANQFARGLLDGAREALARGDPYQAKLLLSLAVLQAQLARAAAQGSAPLSVP